jgi:serine/threonine-protein kinase RsbW
MGNIVTMDAVRAAVDRDTRIVRLTIPARPEYITLGRLALTGLARLEPGAEESLGDLKLALTEACTNSVRHAYANGEGQVEIVYVLCRDSLAIEVNDAGSGFTPPETPIAEASEDDLAEGGLGIAIIRALTDELTLESGEAGGSRLRFVKRF